MTTQTLVSGLGGAIGSHYLADRNRLIFVEFNGKLARYDLVGTGQIISSGQTILEGTRRFDFDTGTQSTVPGGTNWDVFWHMHTSVERSMDPVHGAQIVYLGGISYTNLSAAELQALTYGGAPINGSNNSSNLLTNGAVFAVRTNQGNYAKVQVVHYDRDITIRWRTYHILPQYQVLGSGYTQPEDVVVEADGLHAYVTERSGNLLRVNLGNANRSHAVVVSSGMTAPQQIFLDEARGHAYVVEYARPGRLLRINLASGSQTTLANNLDNAIGLLLTQDLRFAYISEQALGGGRIIRIELNTGHRETVISGLVNPFFLTWTDAGESGILTTERDPANRVILIDLSQATAGQQTIANAVPFRPSSVAVAAANRLLLCSNSELSQLDLTGSVFTPAGPMLLGVGHVPVDRIFNGYADTTGDPNYFFQVKDTPFGGTLSIMLNHTRGFAEGARYYRLFVNDGSGETEPRQTWYDYRWSTSTNQFELQTRAASPSGYYPVRQPNELWYNHWLGYRLNTNGLHNGLCTVRVAFYTAMSSGSQISSHTMQLRLDNSWPIAVIDNILHDGSSVGTCGIVSSGSNNFTFDVIARDNEGHLKSWQLTAMWGDNQSGGVASESYTPVPNRLWVGTPAGGAIVPAPPAAPWHATNRRCAHTFYLNVWDRVIDGYNFIHHATYHKSITIMLP